MVSMELPRVLLTYLSLLISCAVAAEYYVVPSAATGELNCPGSPCHDLAYYINDSDVYFTDNSVFYFMEGIHVFKEQELLIITGVTNLTLTGQGRMEQGFHETVTQSTVHINCRQAADSGIVIQDSTMVSIIGITFSGCGGYLPVDIANTLIPRIGRFFPYNWTKYAIALGLIRTDNVLLEDISIQNSTDFGLLTVNALNFTINRSSFAGNNLANYTNCRLNRCFGGNALIVYTKDKQCKDHFNIYSLSVSHSNFTFGYDSGYIQAISASGLSLYMEQGDFFGINADLNTLVLFGNTGLGGTNIRYVVTSDVSYHSLNMTNCLSVYANMIYPLPPIEPFFIYGGGIHAALGVPAANSSIACSYQIIERSQVPLKIVNNTFSNNYAISGAGMYLSVYPFTSQLGHQFITLESCELKNNTGVVGAGLFYTQFNGLNYILKVINVSITATRQYQSSNISPETAVSATLIERAFNVTFINLTVSDNLLTGMYLLNSIAFITGKNLFKNNSAVYGGALTLYGDSLIALMPPVHILFEENRATERGGAIIVDSVSPLGSVCFLTLHDPRPNDSNLDVSITFSGNVANVAGSAIYGGTINNCFNSVHSLLFSIANMGELAVGRTSFGHLLHYQSGKSVIASDPEQVCFCFNGVPNCSVASLNFRVLPGESANISMVTVGHLSGVSPGVIAIREWNTYRTNIVHTMYESTETQCSSIQYYPNVNMSATFPTLQIVELFLPQMDPQVRTVYFHIEECPLGFQLSSDSGQCVCNSEIAAANVTCNAGTRSFNHYGNKWIGYLNDSQCFITHSGCLLDYCNMSPVNFTLSSTSEECALNRSGLLCGQCAEGLSLMLGSNQCGECTNDYLALIIPFVVAGIALIAFITALDFTVSKGTINGVLFFANVVKINELIFLSRSDRTFRSVFISWINLDLGIETCFFDGMTSYSKIWLQFVFPFYLWFLMILIVILSRYSSKVSKLMGRNVISVLATVLLLSFTKILRTCILVWQINYLSCGQHHLTVWSVDASINYWSSEHLIMILFASFVFFFLAVPYTLLLLFSPLIERYFSRYHCCRWWVKLKPLFDAYNGPYKDKYRFWTGLLLLVRLIIVFVFSYNTNYTTTIASVVTLTGILLGLMSVMKGVYRNKVNDFLECWFLFNLIFLAAISSSTASYGFHILPVILAFIVFVIIVTWQFLERVGILIKMKSYSWSFYYKHIKKSEVAKEGNSVNEEYLSDSRHVVTHDLENMATVELKDLPRALYKEGSVLVHMKRETLLEFS